MGAIDSRIRRAGEFASRSHRPCTVPVVLCAALILSSCGEPRRPVEKGVEMQRFGFPVYPGARVLCEGHVHGATGSGDILWVVYTTAESTETVLGYYEAHLGDGTSGDGQNGVSWRFRERRTDRILIVQPTGAGGLPPDCSEPPASAQSTIQMSNLLKPSGTRSDSAW